MHSASTDDQRPISRDDLERIFFDAEKPPSEFRIGGEAEKIGVDATSGAPVCYDGDRGIRRIFDWLAANHGWTPEAETEGGPPIALLRNKASITLEPGAQFELSGAPHTDVHGVVAEMRAHLAELAPISKELNIAWLGVGFHPLAALADLPWVPKHRYAVMKKYLPERGSRGLDMMQRTATVQANFDYSSEDDAMQKLVLLLRLAPIIHAMTANAPFIEGRVSSRKSERGDVWLHMDPSRSGLVDPLWAKTKPRYSDYVDWALDAGMFLFRRGDTFVYNTGQTFRSFLKDGYEGHRATEADWILHVNSLFPEARLKRTIEMRACDMLPARLDGAVPGLVTGLLYDEKSLDDATELALGLKLGDVSAARPDLVTRGLAAAIGKTPVLGLAERVFDIAESGLARRARASAGAADERVHLAPLKALLSRGQCPADALVEGFTVGQRVAPSVVVERVRI